MHGGILDLYSSAADSANHSYLCTLRTGADLLFRLCFFSAPDLSDATTIFFFGPCSTRLTPTCPIPGSMNLSFVKNPSKLVCVAWAAKVPSNCSFWFSFHAYLPPIKLTVAQLIRPRSFNYGSSILRSQETRSPALPRPEGTIVQGLILLPRILPPLQMVWPMIRLTLNRTFKILTISCSLVSHVPMMKPNCTG